MKSGVVPMADQDEIPIVDSPKFDPIDNTDPVKNQTAAQPEQRKPLRPVTAGELIQNFPKLRPAVIEGLIRKGETVNIVAAPKMGKSWLSMSMALDVTQGTKVFGRFWATPGQVLIIDNELHPETSAHRLPQVAEAKGICLDDYRDKLFIINLRGQLRDMNSLALDLRQFKRGEFSLIILDAWYRFLPPGSDENSNGDVANLYNTLDAVASELDCAFACIHHSSKGNQAGKSVTDTGSGAGSQSRAADCHLVMRQHREDKAVVVEAAVRSFAPVEPFCMRWAFPVFELAEDLNPSELRQDRPTRQAKQGNESGVIPHDQRQREEHDKRKMLMDAYLAFPEGETMRVLREATTMNTNVFKSVNSELIRAGVVTPCKVIKNKRSENGFKADQTAFFRRWDSMGQLLEIPPSPTGPTEVVPVGGTTAPPLGAVSRPTDRHGGTGMEIRTLSDQEVERIGNLFTTQPA